MVELELPFPPSANALWRAVPAGKHGARNILSKAGREYYDTVERLPWPYAPMRGEVFVLVEIYVPDQRRRDTHNLPKAVFDGCTKLGVWEDDAQVRDYDVRHRGVYPGGKIVLTMEEL